MATTSLSSTLSNFSQHLQKMVIKRRSLSNVSTLSVHDKINRYHALTDLSPDNNNIDCLPSIIDPTTEAPKKQRTFLKNLKKANVFNFIIRKRAKTDLKNIGSFTNLAAEVVDNNRYSKDYSSVAASESRPLSDPGSANIRIFKSVTFNDPKYLVFASFSFGTNCNNNGQTSKTSSKTSFSRKDLIKLSKHIYRCILYSSEGLSIGSGSGSDWEVIGCSENLILSDDLDLQFSFVTPFEIRYDYEADTTLRFELQQSRLADKYSTYSESQNLSIDKARRSKPSENSGNKFSTIASISCELNKLANRGFFKAEMNMKNKLITPICSIYLGAEPATVMEKSQGYLSFDLQIILKQYISNNSTEQIFNTYTPYRLMISRFFKSANAFISIYKSREFSLTFSNSNFRAELNDIELNQYNFLKFDSMFRFAIIEANTEKWRCCSDIPISSFLETHIEIPVTENLDQQHRLQKSSTLRSNIGFFKIFVPFESTNKMSKLMNVPRNDAIISPSPSSTTLSTTIPFNSSGRSFSVGENHRPYKLSTVYQHDIRGGGGIYRSESNRASTVSSSRPSSKTDQDLNNNNFDCSKSSEESEEDSIGTTTIIANGHTQAYLMSILQPNKRILVREIYPDREVITEYQP